MEPGTGRAPATSGRRSHGPSFWPRPAPHNTRTPGVKSMVSRVCGVFSGFHHVFVAFGAGGAHRLLASLFAGSRRQRKRQLGGVSGQRLRSHCFLVFELYRNSRSRALICRTGPRAWPSGQRSQRGQRCGSTLRTDARRRVSSIVGTRDRDMPNENDGPLCRSRCRSRLRLCAAWMALSSAALELQRTSSRRRAVSTSSCLGVRMDRELLLDTAEPGHTPPQATATPQ